MFLLKVKFADSFPASEILSALYGCLIPLLKFANDQNLLRIAFWSMNFGKFPKFLRFFLVD